MECFNSDGLPQAIGPYSHAIIHNGLLYSSGQIPLTAEGEMVEGGIKEQTRQVLTNLKTLLESREGALSDVIKVTIYITDMDNFLAVNTIYAEFFGDHKPARSTVAVKTLPKNSLVEMDVIAKLSDYH
eukprot:Anaeramoba_flamelloidesa87420_550.p2 GENE.a87420_550~~a87420_550.p2  ORF type:complete len:128 (+),score=0.18 a87420_550:519-902(+)